MNITEIRKKDTAELPKLVLELREKLRQFQFNMGGSKVKNVKEGRELKKTIARVLTEQTIRNNK